MAEVARAAIPAAPVPRHPPSAFADVQHQPDGSDLNLESLLPADLTFAIEFAQPSRPSKPPAYKPTALPTQLLQPSTSAAVIPPNNPWSYDPSTESCTALPSATQNTSSLQTSRSVPDRAAYSQGPYRHLSGTRVQLSPPPPPPPRGASPLSVSPLPTSPSGPARTSSSSSSSVSPHQSPVHSRSGYVDYGFGAASDGYYGGGLPPPPPPPRDGQSPSGAACHKSDNRSSSLLGKNIVRRNSAGSGYNSGPLPPPPPPPRDSQQASFCTPLDLGSLATSVGDGAVLVTQNSRGGTTPPSGASPSDCWPPPLPPPPPPSKTGTPRTAASVMLQPPPPPPRNDDRLRSRSSSSAAVPYNSNGSYMNGYPSSAIPPPPPPPPRPATAATSGDGHSPDGSNADINNTAGFRAPTLQEAQMLVAAALQDGTDDSLAAALELANKLQTLAAQRIASVPNGNSRQPPPPQLQGPSPYGSCAVNTNRNSVPLGGGGASRGSSYPGQLSGMGSGAPLPLPPPPPLQPTESGRLTNVGSGQVGLYGRGSATPRGIYGSQVPPPPPPPPPRSPANSLLPSTSSQPPPMLPPPPPPPPRAPVPQSPSPEVAAVMAALPEVRSPFALYQRSSDSDYCPTPPDEPALKVDQLSHVTCTTFPAASNPVATASTAAPYGNPYVSGMFGSILGTPFAAPLPSAYSGTAFGAGSAFGSGAFGSELYATPASTVVPGGCDSSQEVSLASLLTTLAALAKQGGSGSAVGGSAQPALSRDAVFAAFSSGSNSATAPETTATMASQATNVGLVAKSTALFESLSPSPQQRMSLAGGSDKGSEVEAVRSPSPSVLCSVSASPGGSSGGSSDTVSTPASSPLEFLPVDGVEDVSSKLHSPTRATSNGVASAVGVKAPAVEEREPATAATGAVVSSHDSNAASIPTANCSGLSGVSLGNLQQAIALLAAGFPSGAASSAAASSTLMPECSNSQNAATETAGMVGMAQTATVPPSAAVISPSDGVTAEELQMAKSLHAALKVVALLESLSGASCVARV